MTIIAAVATADRVIMGCDTAGELDGLKIYQDSKIATLHTRSGDCVLIGTAGNGAIRGVLTRQLELGDGPGEGSPEEWAGSVAEAITTILVNADPPLTNPESEGNAGCLDGVILMAWRNRLWLITAHNATAPADRIAAIGCGAGIALGSLHATIRLGVEPEEAVEEAIRLACRYDGGCAIDDRGPIIRATAESPGAERIAEEC